MVPATSGANGVAVIDTNQRPINPEEIAACAGVPSVASAPIGTAKTSGIPIPGATVSPALDTLGAAQRPRPLRIGDKVRSFVDDVCVSVGLTGLVVNVAPPRYGAPARARVLWDNETVSMADATTFEVVPGRTSGDTADNEVKSA